MISKYVSIKRIEKKYIEEARATLKTVIAEEVKTAMKNNIIDTVYSNPEGEYERTFSMLVSVVCSVVEDSNFSTIIEITPDPDRMNYNYPSIYNADSSYKDMIVEWLDKGTSGSSFYNHPEHNFIGLTAEQVNTIISEALGRAFKRISSK